MTNDNEATNREEPVKENIETPPTVEEGQPDTGEMEAAPTSFRRNIWVLVVIVAVVLAAWIAAKMRGGGAAPETVAPQGPIGAPPGQSAGPSSDASGALPSGTLSGTPERTTSATLGLAQGATSTPLTYEQQLE